MLGINFYFFSTGGMSGIVRVPVWDCVMELPLGKWQRVAQEAGTGFGSSNGFSAGKV